MNAEKEIKQVPQKSKKAPETGRNATSCPDCGNPRLVRAEGCMHCSACGWSACSA